MVGGRSEELMQEGRRRTAQRVLIAVALFLHVGSAVGLDLAARRMQHPRVTCPLPVTSSVGTRVTLAAEVAAVAGAEIRSVRWAVTRSPSGAQYTFSAANRNPTSFTGRNQGEYDVRLTATDSLGRSSTCGVLLTLNSEIELEAPPPPPLPPPAPEPEVTPPPEPPRVVEHHAHEPPPPPQAPVAPPPAPTQAAPIMTVEDEFSNDQEVAATGDNVNATGDVASNGVIRPPGQGVTGAQFGGTPTGTGHGPARPAVAAATAADYTARARFECDESSMRSEFPDAAAQAGITNMRVRVRVVVDANGRVGRVEALNDPGFGFAAAAVNVIRRHCEVTAARDRSGAAAADTKEFAIEFTLE